MKKVFFSIILLCSSTLAFSAIHGKIEHNRYSYDNFSIAIPPVPSPVQISDIVENELVQLFIGTKSDPYHLQRYFMIDVFFYDKNKSLKVNQIYEGIGGLAQNIIDVTYRNHIPIHSMHCHKTTFNGAKANQCLGRGNINGTDAYIAATSIVYPNKKIISNLTMIEPIKNKAKFDWSIYNQLIKSIRINSNN